MLHAGRRRREPDSFQPPAKVFHIECRKKFLEPRGFNRVAGIVDLPAEGENALGAYGGVKLWMIFRDDFAGRFRLVPP